MTLTELLISQLTDPFRVGLLFFLVLTTRRTANQTGNLLPIIFGALFVAVLIPTTLRPTDDKIAAIALGLAANAIILAILFGAGKLFDRLRGG